MRNIPQIQAGPEAEMHLLHSAAQGTHGTFVARMGPVGPLPIQMAFTRCLEQQWLRLVDVDMVHAVPNKPPELCRVFMITTTGRARLAQLRIGGTDGNG